MAWKKVKVGDVSQVQNGCPFKSTFFDADKGLPLISVRYNGDYSDDFLVKNDDILIGMDGDFSPCWWNGGEALLNQRVCRVHPNNSVEPYYLYLSLQKPLKQIEDATHYTTVKHLSAQKVRDISISLPALPEQKAIAQVLRGVKAAKEARERELALERERKAALMQHLFTHGTRGERRKQTPIGEIPESWEVTKFGNYASFNNGINFKKTQKGTGVLTVDVFNMYTDSIYANLDNLYRVQINLRDSYKLSQNDILFVRSSLKQEGVGWPALFKGHDEDVTFCGFIIRASIKEIDELNPDFLVNYLRIPELRARLVSRSGKVSISNISQAVLANLLIPIPSILEQREIANVADAFDSKIESLKKEVIALNELFQAMLDGLMSGQIPVATLLEKSQEAA
jgi:type I restriction enzyme, S subunit